MTKVITITGVVKEFEWVNPHTWLHVTVDDGKGGKVVWLAEGRAPGILLRAGWTRSSLKFGETVTVDMSPAKDGTHKAIIARVTKADGTILSNQPCSSRKGSFDMRKIIVAILSAAIFSRTECAGSRAARRPGHGGVDRTSPTPPDFSGVYYPFAAGPRRSAAGGRPPRRLPRSGEDRRHGPRRPPRSRMAGKGARRTRRRSRRSTWRSGK